MVKPGSEPPAGVEACLVAKQGAGERQGHDQANSGPAVGKYRRGNRHQEDTGHQQTDADTGFGEGKKRYQQQRELSMGVQPVKNYLFDDALSSRLVDRL